MKRLCVYGRKSTEDQETSTEVQLAAGRAFGLEMFKVAPAYEIKDDAISRAEFVRRPGLARVLDLAERGAIDALIIRDTSRLGGEQFQTSAIIQRLTSWGVEVWCHHTRQRVRLDSGMEKLIVSILTAFDEMEREKIAGRTAEALFDMAKKGWVVGGKWYGYTIIKVENHKERRINAAEARIVVRIFMLYADGEGPTAIARLLNDERVPPPASGTKKDSGSWGPETIATLLTAPRYIGKIVHGKMKKGYVMTASGTTKTRTAQPPSTWLELDVPELRVVDQELWERVQARVAASERENHGDMAKRGPRAKYLLTGLAKCALCRGPMGVESAKFGSRQVKVYFCTRARRRGQAVCTNNVRRPMDTINEAFTSWVQANVLSERLIGEVLAEVRARVTERAEAAKPELEALAAEEAALKKEIKNLAGAIAKLGDSDELVALMREKQGTLDRVRTRRQAAELLPSAIDLETRRMEEAARKRIEDLRGMLERNPEEGRKAMEALLDGPLMFKPVKDEMGTGFEITGQVATGRLCVIPNVPTGI